MEGDEDVIVVVEDAKQQSGEEKDEEKSESTCKEVLSELNAKARK